VLAELQVYMHLPCIALIEPLVASSATVPLQLANGLQLLGMCLAAGASHKCAANLPEGGRWN
jgi:hypothetical protein